MAVADHEDQADILRDILAELIAAVRELATWNEGSADSYALLAVVDQADKRLKEIQGG